VSLVMCLWPGN